MAIANSSFKVRNGLVVSGNTTLVGNTTINDNLTVDENLTLSGTLHTVSGNVNFGSDTLHINSTNKRVVINASSTSTGTDVQGTDWAFDVNGKTRFGSNIKVGGTSQFDDDVTIGADGAPQPLTVWGAANVRSTFTVAGNTTISGNSVTIGSGTTPNTVIEGNVWVKGTIKTGSDGNYYDLDSLSTTIGNIPVLKVYNVSDVQVFP